MAPETVIISASVVCAGILLAMVWLTRYLARPPITVTAERFDELFAKTTDLMRLLGEEDGQVLRTHLPRLKDDFKLICMAVKLIMLQSERDRPDLARLLVRSQITFAYRMMRVRFRLGVGSWVSRV